MATMPHHNFVCRECDAKLLAKRIRSPFRPRERATCPHCNEIVPARDADDLIQYELVERPKARERYRPKADWYQSR